MKKAILVLALLIVVAGMLALIPYPINATAYHPPAPPEMTGPLAVNKKLDQLDVLAPEKIHGAEDVDVDALGRIYGATEDGAIMRINTDGSVETLAQTGGRPLGLHWDAQGNLIICDAFKGLLSLSANGELKTLLTEVDGQPLVFTDDLEIAADGTIYFSDASTRFDQKHYILDMLEARPWGRLIAYSPSTGEAKTLLNELYFANGIAISSNQDFVLINETYRYRITRYWISGPKQGQSDIFIDNLPGFPDGVSSSGRGTFWVALPTVRNQQADAMHPHPLVKNIVAKLPDFARPQPQPYGLILELDETGRVLRSLHDPEGDNFPIITSVQEANGKLYLGSLTSSGIGELTVPTLAGQE